MSPRRYQFEVFDVPSATEHAILIDAASLETAKLEAYERGYASGWDDAQAGQAEQDAHVRTALTQQLQDFSFTYHEARQAILRSVQPVLTAIVDAVLPGVIRDLAGQHVIEHLRAAMFRHTAAPLRLHHHPAMTEILNDVATQQGSLALDLRPDPSLPEGRFVLERGECEVELDLDRLCGDIRSLVRAHLGQVSERNPS